MSIRLGVYEAPHHDEGNADDERDPALPASQEDEDCIPPPLCHNRRLRVSRCLLRCHRARGRLHQMRQQYLAARDLEASGFQGQQPVQQISPALRDP